MKDLDGRVSIRGEFVQIGIDLPKRSSSSAVALPEANANGLRISIFFPVKGNRRHVAWVLLGIAIRIFFGRRRS